MPTYETAYLILSNGNLKKELAINDVQGDMVSNNTRSIVTMLVLIHKAFCNQWA